MSGAGVKPAVAATGSSSSSKKTPTSLAVKSSGIGIQRRSTLGPGESAWEPQVKTGVSLTVPTSPTALTNTSSDAKSVTVDSADSKK